MLFINPMKVLEAEYRLISSCIRKAAWSAFCGWSSSAIGAPKTAGPEARRPDIVHLTGPAPEP
jgi:hypothetical protein